MDEQEGLRQAGLAMSSDKEITITLPIRELWLIVSALQLMVTHPNLHEPLQTISEGIGRKLGALIILELPDVEPLLEQGWHREYDYIDEYDDGDYDDLDDDDLDGYYDPAIESVPLDEEDNAPPSDFDVPNEHVDDDGIPW